MCESPSEAVKDSKVTNKRQRLAPNEREELILQRAISYFAHAGFDAGTRELARQIGVSQPLLFKYFPNKEDLIHAVYERVYLNRWRNEWHELLCDRSRPLADRMRNFYQQYTAEIFNEEWLRIYLFSGLKGVPINRWYIEMVETRILRIIIQEFYHEANISESGANEAANLEIAWILQGGIFYYGLRKYIYKTSISKNLDRYIGDSIDIFLSGISDYYGVSIRSRSLKVHRNLVP